MQHPFILEIDTQYHRESLLAEATAERLARQAKMPRTRSHLSGIAVGGDGLKNVKRRLAELYARARSARLARGSVKPA